MEHDMEIRLEQWKMKMNGNMIDTWNEMKIK